MLIAKIEREAVKIIDSITWALEVEANEDTCNNIQSGENRHDIDTVFCKFDLHFWVHNNRNITRQEFLNTKRRKTQ